MSGLRAERWRRGTKLTIISHRHKFIFVRPRKVASTTIMASLLPSLAEEDVVISDPWDQSCPSMDDDQFGLIPLRAAHGFSGLAQLRGGQRHIPPEAIRKNLTESQWDEYFKFTVVRNPWDWFVSLYCWKIRSDWPRHRLRDIRSSLRSPRTVLRARYRLYRASSNYAPGRHPQNVEFILKRKWFAEFMDDQPAFYFLDGSRYADYYIHFENLQRDYDEVCRLLQLPRRRLPRTHNRVRDGNKGYHNYYTDWSRDYVARQSHQIIDAFGYRF